MNVSFEKFTQNLITRRISEIRHETACFSSVTFFALSEVVKNFDNCKNFFLNDKPPKGFPNSFEHICQCLWDENDQKIYVYATLYSTTWKIPVYSAYVFRQSKSIGRCDAWYIEPQLDKEDEPCMRPKGRNQKIGTNQALNSDYENSGYNKGHLYPVLHTSNHLSMLATSTLTNAAPQNSDFNQKAWLRHEEAVVEDLKSCDEEAYVVTGVVPDINHKIEKKSVTVSKYYWSATCCLKGSQYIGKGYYGPDNNGRVQELTIAELQNDLQIFYKLESSISIFPAQICQKLNRKRERE
ncbi:endonuclease domain-containing 1 protein [Onychostoma macrolepis]|uniref:endonuclease domain-containing 1 protein n=1 Tax=Onychostoma macrolepis TaxID=369639 RepID=UPI00272AB336|nr:endonuclease domain-containing 1 protein [Onychostoma macrolepis]